MLKIRLMRIGGKKRPFYRVVAVDEQAKRTGGYIEALGTYNPLTEPKEIKLKQDRIDYWIKQGAQPSTGYLRIIGKAPQRKPRKPKKEKKSPPAPTTPAAENQPAPIAESVPAPETPKETEAEKPTEVAQSTETPKPEEESVKETATEAETTDKPTEQQAPAKTKEPKNEGSA